MRDSAQGKTYPEWKKLIAERNEAISQARFWRQSFFIIGVACFISNGITIAKWLGWI